MICYHLTICSYCFVLYAFVVASNTLLTSIAFHLLAFPFLDFMIVFALNTLFFLIVTLKCYRTIHKNYASSIKEVIYSMASFTVLI